MALYNRGFRVICCCLGLALWIQPGRIAAQASSSEVVLQEEGLPAADSIAPSREQLTRLFPQARLVSAEALDAALTTPETKLLVLPYGSAFPESSWAAIFNYLERGGNLVALGGRPFSRAAYRDANGWHLRDYSVRFLQQLSIDQYQETPGSNGLRFEANTELPIETPAFEWSRAFSPVIRLSASAISARGGSSGYLDARMDALAWGVKDGRRVAAPVLEIDHLRSQFAGGRWILVNAELNGSFFADAGKWTSQLASRASEGSEEFLVRPVLPLYLPGEPVEVALNWLGSTKPNEKLTAKITLRQEGSSAAPVVKSVDMPAHEPLLFPAPSGKGFYVIQAELMEGKRLRASYRSGFWIRDEAYLRSGPRMTVNHNYFEIDGKPILVVGTTYMASDVQRLYFDHPNVYVWDQDMAQMHAAGLNMLRAGWWTGWDKLCDEEGVPYERTLRTVEAYLMTARKYGLPVQFNVFAFLPEVLGGQNAYLDPVSVRREQTLIGALAKRFGDVPYLGWDLINEPSFSTAVWKNRPNGDAFELAKWNDWISHRYPDRNALAHAWNLPSLPNAAPIALPVEAEFDPLGMNNGHNSLKLYDFNLFSQETFAAWVHGMRAVIRGEGSHQLVTVGQDEGGSIDRMSPTFLAPEVDFTAMHSWWLDDSILWDSLSAKQPGVPMLIQETGMQRQSTLDEVSRRTPESEGALVERKIAMSLIGGAGAIQWLWNTNDYMVERNEAPIGALRGDGTEKPEAKALRDFAAFARQAGDKLQEPRLPEVAIVTSQAVQYSALAGLQIRAQQRAVRAASYDDHMPVYMIAENHIAQLGSPRLAILPSSQALAQSSWDLLLKYVENGGNLLLTGPAERDEHWHPVSRLAELKIDVHAEPLRCHTAEVRVKDRDIPANFGQEAQLWLDIFKFADGSSFKTIPYGKGKLFVSAYPLELAEGEAAAAEVYQAVMDELAIQPRFESTSALPAGVLVYPTELRDSVLYVLVSEDAHDRNLDLRDKPTGGVIQLRLPALHAALVLLRKSDGSIQAKYGF
ncbi:MAG TPA: hypothetical protein VM554_02760 [Acidisarcina sp.]|nr:hypothetical protein [Acidisarcina sp.]